MVSIDCKSVLSIIIPVHNVEKHLEKCLDSVIDDTVSGYEIILVDDGSTDGSPAICDAYRDRYPFIKTVHRAVSGSAAVARNAGIEIASGDYITFLDSDDHVDQGYVKELTELVKSGYDIYAFSYYTDFLETGITDVRKLTDAVDISAGEALRELEKKGAFNFLWNKVYKKSLLDQAPKTSFPPDTEPGEDLIFNVLCFEKAETVSLYSTPYYHWVRRGEDTLANRYRKNLNQKIFMFIEYRNRLYQSLGMDETDAALLARGNIGYVFSCIPNMYRTGQRFPKKERLGFYKEIIESEKIAYWLSVLENPPKLTIQFISVYKKHSPRLMDLYYSAVMSFRNIFGTTWNKLRNRL